MRIINAVLPAVLAISVFASAQDTTSPVSDSEVQSLINKVDQDLIPTLQAAAVGSEMRGMPSDELRGRNQAIDRTCRIDSHQRVQRARSGCPVHDHRRRSRVPTGLLTLCIY